MANTNQSNDLDPRVALAYARQMKDYCDSFAGRDWAMVMAHGSVDEQNLAHALDNLIECAAMLMNVADRVKRSEGLISDMDGWLANTGHDKDHPWRLSIRAALPPAPQES